MSAPWVVPAFDEVEHGQARVGLRREALPIEQLALEGREELSQRALSYALPTLPIDGRTPASRHRTPKAMEVYCAGSTSRRNTAMLN